MVMLSRKAMMGSRNNTWSLEVTEFTQSIDTVNLVPNPDFEGDNPLDLWNAAPEASIAAAADQRPGGIGTNSLEVTQTVETNITYGYDTFPGAEVGAYYLLGGWMRVVDATHATIRGISGTNNWYAPWSSYWQSTNWGRAEVLFSARATNVGIRASMIGGVGNKARFDDLYVYRVVPNSVINADAADMEVEVDWSPPTETWSGQELRLCYRVQGAFGAGNMWALCMLRDNTNSGWDFSLVSYADGARTERSKLNGIGTPEKLRVIAHGTKHQCFMYANSVWMPLCPVVDVDYLTTETGINTIYSEDMAPTSLRARASRSFGSGLSGSSLMFIDGDSKSDNTDSYGDWDFMLKYLAERVTGRGWNYYNVADAGASFLTGLSALPAKLAALPDAPTPDTAIINFGANDVQSAQVEATWKQRVRDYVELLHAKWPTMPIRLMLPWREGYDAESDALCSWITDVAAEYEYVSIGPDERLWFKTDPSLWYGTGVHYNGAGSRECAVQWRDVLFP